MVLMAVSRHKLNYMYIISMQSTNVIYKINVNYVKINSSWLILQFCQCFRTWYTCIMIQFKKIVHYQGTYIVHVDRYFSNSWIINEVVRQSCGHMRITCMPLDTRPNTDANEIQTVWISFASVLDLICIKWSNNGGNILIYLSRKYTLILQFAKELHSKTLFPIPCSPTDINYSFIWEASSQTRASCFIRGSKHLETDESTRPRTASCFHQFRGPWWSTRLRTITNYSISILTVSIHVHVY